MLLLTFLETHNRRDDRERQRVPNDGSKTQTIPMNHNPPPFSELAGYAQSYTEERDFMEEAFLENMNKGQEEIDMVQSFEF